MALRIAMCCNNPDNGVFQGKTDFIEIEDVRLYGPEVTCREEDRTLKSARPVEGNTTLRIGRVCVPCLAYKTWWGNWCWDCASVRAVNALKVLNYLIERGWRCEEAADEVFEAVNAGKPIDGPTWKRFVSEGLLE